VGMLFWWPALAWLGYALWSDQRGESDIALSRESAPALSQSYQE
jgi:hypothetical protein